MLCQNCQKNKAQEEKKMERNQDVIYYTYCKQCERKENNWFKFWFALFLGAMVVYLYGFYKLIVYLIKLVW